MTRHLGCTANRSSDRNGENTDQYGRLLRYVDDNGVDAALRLIEGGLALARYDSRDGYGSHERENTYAVVASCSLTSPSPSPSAACSSAAAGPERTVMREITCAGYGRPAVVLCTADVDEPTIADNQILVRVHAASVNPADSGT